MAAALIAVFSISIPIRAADRITVKSDTKRLAGEVSSISKKEVVIKTGLRKDKPKTVPVNDIIKIEWDREPAKLNTFRNAEAAGNLQLALTGYQTLLKDPKVTNAKLKADLTYFIARTTARLALADPGKLDEAITKLKDFHRTNANSYHFYELLSHLGSAYLAKKDYPLAKSTYKAMSLAPWQDVQLKARNEEGRVWLAEGKAKEALDIFKEVLAKTVGNLSLKALATDATLGKAACQVKTKKYAEAIRELEIVIDTAPQGDSHLLARAYTLQGDCYRNLDGRQKDALLAYLHVDVLFENETEFHPKALYYLSKLWAELGNGVRAGAAKAKLTQTKKYENSEWAKMP